MPWRSIPKGIVAHPNCTTMAAMLDGYRSSDGKWFRSVSKDLAAELLAEIDGAWAVHGARPRPRRVPEQGGLGWNWSDSRKALDYLYMVGDLAIARRTNQFEADLDLVGHAHAAALPDEGEGGGQVAVGVDDLAAAALQRLGEEGRGRALERVQALGHRRGVALREVAVAPGAQTAAVGVGQLADVRRVRAAAPAGTVELVRAQRHLRARGGRGRRGRARARPAPRCARARAAARGRWPPSPS